MKKLFLMLPVLSLLCSCSLFYPDYLTQKDTEDLTGLRVATRYREKNTTTLQVIHKDPDYLAKVSAEKGDFRLISISVGLPPENEEEKHSFTGINCSQPVETKDVTFGCVPPPIVVFKLLLRYNQTLVSQPNFPQKYGCKPIDLDLLKL